MGLRDTRMLPDKVTVVLHERREVRGRMQTVETGRVECYGRLQESSSEDIATYASAGEQGVLSMRRLYTRRFPGDDLSTVIDGDGVSYAVVGDPKRHQGSRRTRRDVVTLRKKGLVREYEHGESV